LPLFNEKIESDLFLKEIVSELKIEKTYVQKNILAGILNLYLLRLERKSSTNNPLRNTSKNYSLFIQFKNLVENNYTKTRNVKDYAELMFVSTKHLNKVIKDFTLSTAKTFIDNYVILEIKRAIVTTNQSFKEISFEIGFDEVTNFTKFFKKHTTITPKQFKTSL
jgi:AraC-like DNA-binding protein